MLTPVAKDIRGQIVNLEELAELARKKLDPVVHDIIAGGAGSERTLKANREAFDEVTILPRILTGIKQVDASTSILGQRVSVPFYVTPMANHGIAHPSAEAATAQGASRAGALFVAPTASNKTLEEIAVASGDGPRWFQLYLNRNPDVNVQLLQRVEKAGYSAVVLTVDLPVIGTRERDIRNRFTPSGELKRSSMPSDDSLAAMRNLQSLVEGLKESLTWDDYEWVREHTSLPVLIKGILSPDDAEEAATRRVPAIVVSNHGGRQLDTGFGAIEALEPIVKIVRGRTRVLFDSGIRRGTDVFKALALGADAVGLGRPVLWGLALWGAEGVAAVLEHLRAELVNVMHLAGTERVANISREFLR